MHVRGNSRSVVTVPDKRALQLFRDYNVPLVLLIVHRSISARQSKQISENAEASGPDDQTVDRLKSHMTVCQGSSRQFCGGSGKLTGFRRSLPRLSFERSILVCRGRGLILQGLEHQDVSENREMIFQEIEAWQKVANGQPILPSGPWLPITAQPNSNDDVHDSSALDNKPFPTSTSAFSALSCNPSFAQPLFSIFTYSNCLSWVSWAKRRESSTNTVNLP